MEKTSVVNDWSDLLTVHLYGNVQSSVLSMHDHTKLLHSRKRFIDLKIKTVICFTL